MKKLIFALVVISVFFSALSIGAYAAGIGSAAAVLANEIEFIKTGLLGQSLPFSDTDFKTALGTADITSITITELPEDDEGTLMLGERRIKVGQTIRRKNLGELVFIPASGSVTEADFKFRADGIGSDTEFEVEMKFIEKVNYAPTAGSNVSESLTVTTQSGISVYGELEGDDPEDDDIEFIIVSYPTLGALTLIDKSTGYFRYTPRGSECGADSFVYVARDEYGNYSAPCTVKLSVIERMSEVVYYDMLDSESYNAAVALSAMGIMGGTLIGDNTYFMPGENVTRAEFVAMAMKTVGVRADSTITETFFDDNDDIPTALIGYVATAQRCGIINGSFDGKGLLFRPNDAITRYEAAIIMANLTGSYDTALEAFAEGDDVKAIPIWARAHVGAMCKLGIYDTESALTGAKDALTREEVAEYLYRLANTRK